MNKIREFAGEVVGTIKPLLAMAGVLLAAAIGIDQFIVPVPKVDASTSTLALAALLVFAGR
jgi:hypothetical protein